MGIQTGEQYWNQVWFVPSILSKERLICPILLSGSLIALTLNIAIETGWRLGAYVEREINTGLIVGGLQDAQLNSARKLYVNRLQVFSFNDIQTDYSLVVNPLVYGNGVSLSVWEYTGIIT